MDDLLEEGDRETVNSKSEEEEEEDDGEGNEPVLRIPSLFSLLFP